MPSAQNKDTKWVFYEEVEKKCYELLRKGADLTGYRVFKEIGRGSKATIQKHVDRFINKRERLQPVSLSAPMLDFVKELTAIIDDSLETDQLVDLRSEIKALLRHSSDTIVRTLSRRIEDLENELAQLKGSHAGILQVNKDLQTENAALAERCRKI